MAYQNVSTPRFYVNALEWLSNSTPSSFDSIFNTLPVDLTNTGELSTTINIIDNLLGDKSFIAILGHNMKTTVNSCRLSMDGNYLQFSLGINIGSTYEHIIPSYDGFTIAKFVAPVDDELILTFNNVGNFGSILIGNYYDMTVNPNLSLKMSREYGGIDELVSYNGSSYTNQAWLKPPAWGEAGAWEIYNNTSYGASNWLNVDTEVSRSGRKSWDLSFSYIDDSDIFGSNQMITRISPYTDNQNIDIGYDSDDVLGYTNEDQLIDPDSPESKGFTNNLLTDNNFFSQVWQKTLGGTLPFIFQPDKDNNNPDQFAICRFAENSLKVNQTAFNVYDISLKIEESW